MSILKKKKKIADRLDSSRSSYLLFADENYGASG